MGFPIEEPLPSPSSILKIWYCMGWVLILALVSCREQPDNAVRIDGLLLPAEQVETILSLSPLPSIPPSPTNRYADNPHAALLGQHLFYEERLSLNGKISCASCHDPNQDWSDGRALSVGLKPLSRHAPTLWNLAWQRWYYWDGRKDSIWSQAMAPIEHPSEMGGSRGRAYDLVAADPVYRELYQQAFGALPELHAQGSVADTRPELNGASQPDHPQRSGLSPEDRDPLTLVFSHLGKAMEAYQRQLISSDSPFDRFVGRLRRGERHLLTPEFNQQHLRGLVIFTGKGQCTLCHAGPTLTDHEFHNIGLDRGGSELDQGRYPAVEQVKNDPFNGQGLFSDDPSLEANQALHYVTTRDSNLGEFKTPTLRNVARTAPYMHDGRFETLEEVVTFYSTLPDEPALGHREESLQPLGLRGDEVKDLVAFLETLTGAPLDPALMRAPGVRP